MNKTIWQHLLLIVFDIPILLFHYHTTHRNFTSIQYLSELGADVNLKCFGTPCLHLILTAAALPHGKQFGMKAFSLLLSQVDLSAKVCILYDILFHTNLWFSVYYQLTSMCRSHTYLSRKLTIHIPRMIKERQRYILLRNLIFLKL